ncbi:MAG: SseB family protein [Eubacterium sp.]|nr:SseB family protein [Eubacterium sp.]
MSDTFTENKLIEDAILAFDNENQRSSLAELLNAIRTRMQEGGQLLIPAVPAEDHTEFAFNTVRLNDGSEWLVFFTSQEESQKVPAKSILTYGIREALQLCTEMNAPGFVFNPWGEAPFIFTRELIQLLFDADAMVTE